MTSDRFLPSVVNPGLGRPDNVLPQPLGRPAGPTVGLDIIEYLIPSGPDAIIPECPCVVCPKQRTGDRKPVPEDAPEETGQSGEEDRNDREQTETNANPSSPPVSRARHPPIVDPISVNPHGPLTPPLLPASSCTPLEDTVPAGVRWRTEKAMAWSESLEGVSQGTRRMYAENAILAFAALGRLGFDVSPQDVTAPMVEALLHDETPSPTTRATHSLSPLSD